MNLGKNDPKQNLFCKEANIRAEKFLAEYFCPHIQSELSQEIGREANIFIDQRDKQTVIFAYPRLFHSASTLQVIRLEIGVLAAWTPVVKALIEPFAGNFYPYLFEQKSTEIITVTPERTFWEKATILHHEANRPPYLKMPQRYSRHYYDLYCISMSSIKESAFSQLQLLKRVVDFKMKFYPRSWAQYQEAVPRTLKLVPPVYRLSPLQADYVSMKEMFYGDIPPFDTVMDRIKKLEHEINRL